MFKTKSNPILRLSKDQFPSQFLQIPQPPKQLFLIGELPKKDYKILAVVGSRKFSAYGKMVCEKIIAGLARQPIVIVSGLALGIDSIAHRAALQAGLQTIALPGSGLDEEVLYPHSHINLAREIVQAGGGLLSEFEPTWPSYKANFPQRNRLIAGIADAVLIIECERKSGTLITARLASDYNKDVLTIPGSIFSATSTGPHLLLKLGATPITSAQDVIEALHLETEQNSLWQNHDDCNKDEQKILQLLNTPKTRDDLLIQSQLSPAELNSALMMLEIKNYIVEKAGQVIKK
jgi:DNA protecting protein DprA